MSTKKTGFFTCTGCHRKFASGTGYMAPKNKLNLKNVCKPCFKKHFGAKSVPLPVAAALPLKNIFGSLLTYGGGLISNTAGGVISNGGSGIISDKSGGILGNSSASLLGNTTNTLLGNSSNTLVGHDGSSFRRR